jgi:hypothetical protein
MLRVTMTQHAVGQGGLASGTIGVGGSPLRWVYDCGSDQPRPLCREIRRVARGGELRHLFLSHLAIGTKRRSELEADICEW